MGFDPRCMLGPRNIDADMRSVFWWCCDTYLTGRANQCEHFLLLAKSLIEAGRFVEGKAALQGCMAAM